MTAQQTTSATTTCTKCGMSGLGGRHAGWCPVPGSWVEDATTDQEETMPSKTALRDMNTYQLRDRMEEVRTANPHTYETLQSYRNARALLYRKARESETCPKCGMGEHAPDAFCDTLPV